MVQYVGLPPCFIKKRGKIVDHIQRDCSQQHPSASGSVERGIHGRLRPLPRLCPPATLTLAGPQPGGRAAASSAGFQLLRNKAVTAAALEVEGRREGGRQCRVRASFVLAEAASTAAVFDFGVCVRARD